MSQDASKSTGQKRKLEEVDKGESHGDKPQTNGLTPAQTSATAPETGSNKCRIEEGFSWWTCMQYDMPLSKTHPQRVPAKENADTYEERRATHVTSAVVWVSDLMSQEAPRTADNADKMPTGQNPPCSSSSSCDEMTKANPLELPPKPQEPLASDCCGTGCSPCVYDIYEQEVKLWEEECGRIQRGDEAECDKGEVLSPHKYTKFEIESMERDAVDSFCYTFTIPNHRRLPLKVGQHLVLRCYNGEKPITRQYTPISDPETRGSFSVVIKLYEGGEMSKCVRRWQPGDKIDWRGPFGDFTYTPNSYDSLVLLAAGTGLAPMLQVVHHVVHNERDDTRVRLLYACPSYRHILCKAVLDDFASYWNFSVVYVLSQEKPGNIANKRYGDEVVCGRLDETLLTAELEAHTTSPKTKLLICGTKSFDKDMINFLSRRGLTQEQYFRF